MTDNSAAEKAALTATWPEGRQLLCHFHVAQAEWRWLTAARNNIEKDQRRVLMTKFQQVCVSNVFSWQYQCMRQWHGNVAGFQVTGHIYTNHESNIHLHHTTDWLHTHATKI